MRNQCPACREQAMNDTARILRRPFVCRHCGRELRMNLVYTAIVSVVFFVVVLRLLLAGGMTAASIFYVLLATLAFVAACLFIPFEPKKAQQEE